MDPPTIASRKMEPSGRSLRTGRLFPRMALSTVTDEYPSTREIQPTAMEVVGHRPQGYVDAFDIFFHNGDGRSAHRCDSMSDAHGLIRDQEFVRTWWNVSNFKLSGGRAVGCIVKLLSTSTQDRLSKLPRHEHETQARAGLRRIWVQNSSGDARRIPPSHVHNNIQLFYFLPAADMDWLCFR